MRRRFLCSSRTVAHKASRNEDTFQKCSFRVEQAAPQAVVVFRALPEAQTDKMVSRFGNAYINRLTQWMQDTFAGTAGGTRCWVSGIELLFGFMLGTHFLPPVYIANRKRWERNPHLVASVAQRTRWFCQQLTGLARAHGLALDFEERWSSCAALGRKHQCIALALPEQQRVAIRDYFGTKLGSCGGALNERWRSLPLPEVCLRRSYQFSWSFCWDPSGAVLPAAELYPCPKSCEKLGLGFRVEEAPI